MILNTCIRCGETLVSNDDILRGYDDTCRDILNAAAIQVYKEFSASQVRKAAMSLRSGAVQYIEDGLFRVISSDGQSVYYTTKDECPCPAQSKCYHIAAVRMMLLTRVTV